MTTDLIGKVLMAGAGAFAVWQLVKPQVFAAVSKPAVKLGSVTTRIQALTSLDALLTYFSESNNSDGVAAIQNAIAASTKVEPKK